MTPAMKNHWEVLMLFLIPIGGGIPGGVVLAQKYGIAWPMMALLYFISDVILACVFEPVLLLFIAGGKRISSLKKFNEVMKKSMSMSIMRYGTNLGPLSLILSLLASTPCLAGAWLKLQATAL